MRAIALSGVGVGLGGEVILDDIDLSVEAGERVALLGSSGSGKTTLLRVIAGLQRPTRGTVSVHGAAVTGIPEAVTMVFQGDAVYDHLDVAGNLGFPLAGGSSTWKEERVGDVADAFAIRRLLARHPRTLSAGQRRTVAAARAMVRSEASIVLLDEPLVGTDPHRRLRMVEAVMARPDLTVLLASNDPADAMRWADRMVVLAGGRIVQSGTPADVYRHPVSLDVGELTGEMNRIPGALVGEGDWAVEIGGSRLVLEPGPGWVGQSGKRVVVGVRPSDLSIASPGMPFDRRLRATVGRVEPLGPAQRILFGLGRQRGVGFVAEVGTDVRLTVGERVDWHVPASLIRLYEPVTGRVL